MSSGAPPPSTVVVRDYPANYGEGVPWGDASWYRGYNSPYYNASHHAWRQKVRAFVEAEIIGNEREWDESKQVPKDLYTKMFRAGILPAVCGAPWPEEFVGAGGVSGFLKKR